MTTSAASSGQARMRQSVIVPTFQRRDLVVQAVRALVTQEQPPLEVVVVVDGSTDGTGDALRGLSTPFPLRVVEQANAGAARARNHGAALAAGELLLFLDDDMEADPQLLGALRRAHEAGADAVVGHIPNAPGTSLFEVEGGSSWAETRRARLTSGGELTDTDVLTGQLSMRREVFWALGGFDERFTAGGTFGGEDLDLGRRLLAAGYRVDFAPDAVSHQHYSITPAAYLRQWHDAGAADVTYVRKHPDHHDAVISRRRPSQRPTRLLIRPLARVPVLRRAVAALARPAAMSLADRRRHSRQAQQAFFKVRDLEYWRGVEEAGGLPAPRGVRVLCYHAVRDLAGTRIADYGVPPDHLARQLRLLRRAGFRFVTLDEALRAVRRERGVPRRAVLVTFDDCYADLLESGVPVLDELRVPAAAFAVAGRLGATNTWDERIGAPSLPLLDAEGLRALVEHGLEVGVHGSTHVPLSSVSDDPTALSDETAGATRMLRDAGLAVRSFAYPHGNHDPAVRAAVAAAGLQAAFTVAPGVARPGADPFRLPRVEVLRRDGSGAAFLLKVWVAGRLPRVDRRRLRRAVRKVMRR